MIESTTKIGGVITFWTLADLSVRSTLAGGFELAGFKKFIPEPRPPAGALRDALEEVCGGARVLIRPLNTKDGFSVHREERGDENAGNKYPLILTAKINPETRAIRFNPLDERAEPIIEAFNKNLGLLRQHQVSAALVEIVKSLGGTSHLRPTGGIYWLPDNRLDEWKRVAEAVEGAAFDKTSAVYIIRHRLDADAVRAVHDAIVAEVTKESTEIKEEIISGTLGERALANRQAAAEALREKIALYESLLGVNLDKIRVAAGEAADAAAAAVILASAGTPETVPA